MMMRRKWQYAAFIETILRRLRAAKTFGTRRHTRICHGSVIYWCFTTGAMHAIGPSPSFSPAVNFNAILSVLLLHLAAEWFAVLVFRWRLLIDYIYIVFSWFQEQAHSNASAPCRLTKMISIRLMPVFGIKTLPPLRLNSRKTPFLLHLKEGAPVVRHLKPKTECTTCTQARSLRVSLF